MLDPIAAKRLSIEELKQRNQAIQEKEQRGEALTADEQQEKQVLASAYQFKLDEIEAQNRDEAERYQRERQRRGMNEETEREPFWFRKAW